MAKCFHIEFKIENKPHMKKSEVRSKIETYLLPHQPYFPIIHDSLKVTGKSQGGAKAKAAGSDYERRVATKIGMWWDQKPYRRTPNSGGWDKQVGDGEIRAAGDLIPPSNSTFPFCVECKHRKDSINFFSVTSGKSDSSTLIDWWNQACREAKTVKKMPLLVFYGSRTEYVAFDSAVLMHYFGMINDTKRRLKIMDGPEYVCTVMLLDDFLVAYKKVEKRE